MPAFNPFKRLHIGPVFFGSFAGFIVVVLLIVIFVSYHFSVREMAQSTTYYQQKILTQLDQQLHLQMTEIENTSLAISRNSHLLNYVTQPKADPYTRFTHVSNVTFDLSNITFSTPMIHSIHLYVADPPGSDLQDPVKFADLEQLPGEVWYDAVENTDFAWIGQHKIVTNQGSRAVISFARKVYTPTYDYAALLLLNIRAEDITRIMQGEDDQPSRVLLDSGLRPVASIGELESEDYTAIIRELQSEHGADMSREGSQRYQDSLIVWSKLYNSDWMLLEVTPWSTITRGSLDMAKVLFSIGLAAVLVALVLTLLLSKQFTRPILLLLKRMNHFPLAQPGLRERALPQDYHNEFGALFKGFRTLSDRITELYRSLEQQYRKQREAEIQALQAMINPHFLYNTLDQLNWMAIEAGRNDMSRVLELVGRMFRIGLSNGQRLIPIDDELTHLDCYLQIQQIRMGEGLTYELDVPEALTAYYIPKLTLQPFVENAVMHGFHDRAGGHLLIRAEERGGDIAFTITDDGVGLQPNWQEDEQRKTGGYGMRNVRERVCAYYGQDYDIEAVGRPGAGTTIRLRIPKIKDTEAIQDVENGYHR
ncbi:cache domain-containing sensor histidine kinase [Paenibacillus sp. 1P07SE]|uniref:cache domain-containing sensor histidine kinase n=1 Tax=Paenibacillus sp. 1P07SE TaxID=3132209 RepID=UPI0039A6CBEB